MRDPAKEFVDMLDLLDYLISNQRDELILQLLRLTLTGESVGGARRRARRVGKGRGGAGSSRGGRRGEGGPCQPSGFLLHLQVERGAQVKELLQMVQYHLHFDWDDSDFF